MKIAILPFFPTKDSIIKSFSGLSSISIILSALLKNSGSIIKLTATSSPLPEESPALHSCLKITVHLSPKPPYYR